jgi:serine/threonine-protein kinase
MTTASDFSGYGPYLLVRTSGAGGMGRVQLALRVDGEKPEVCVLKRMHTDERTPEQDARFEREARIAARLSHDNIARTVRVEVIEGELCLAQEFVEGANLARVLRKAGASEPLPGWAAAHLVREVASALTYAHELDGLEIVHRDVTPENVMLSWAGEVKLIDFGISRSRVDGTLTSAGMVIGRRAYMAPEVWAGERPDRRADVYSLGVVLWEILTGRRLEELDEAIWREGVPDPQTVRAEAPSDLAAIAVRALAPEPAGRYQSALELRDALARFVQSVPDPKLELAGLLAFHFDVVQARQIIGEQIEDARKALGAKQAPARLARAGRGWWIAAGVAVLVVASGIALAPIWRNTEERPTRDLPERAISQVQTPAPALGEAKLERIALSPRAAAAEAAVAPAPVAKPRVQRRTAGAVVASETKENAGDLLRRANEEFDDGHLGVAIGLARRSLSAGGGAEAHALLGYIYMSKGELADAERELAEAIRQNPRDAEAGKRLADVRRARTEQER